MGLIALLCQETLPPSSPPQASASCLLCPVSCDVPCPLGKRGVWAILIYGREHWRFEVAKRVQSRCKSKDSKENLIPKSLSFLPPLAPLGKGQGVSACSVTYSSSLCFRSLHKQTRWCSEFGLRNPQVSFGPSLTSPSRLLLPFADLRQSKQDATRRSFPRLWIFLFHKPSTLSLQFYFFTLKIMLY